MPVHWIKLMREGCVNGWCGAEVSFQVYDLCSVGREESGIIQVKILIRLQQLQFQISKRFLSFSTTVTQSSNRNIVIK